MTAKSFQTSSLKVLALEWPTLHRGWRLELVMELVI